LAQLTEDFLVEQPALNWLKELKYEHVHGSKLCPENSERDTYRSVILKRRFLERVKLLNPWISQIQLEDVYKRVTEIDHPDFIVKSQMFYDMLIKGVKLLTKENDEERTRLVKLVDFENLQNNEYLAANQFVVEYEYEGNITRRPDIAIFINGLPLAVFELKSFNANETARDAYEDHKRKKANIGQFYVYTQILVASDGAETKYGAKTSEWDRFFPWEGIFNDEDIEAKRIEENRYAYTFKPTGQKMTSLEIILKGLFRREHLMEYLQDFVLYENLGETYENKIAMYHQFYATRRAIQETRQIIQKAETPQQRRIGVIWHTQGTGKSLTMMFYARKALKIKELENPILLFITDRNNLDEQLYGAFSSLPIAKQAANIKDLKKTITTLTGGIVFATIQKFGKKKIEEYPLLSQRKNIIVIADEAHRSEYQNLAQNLRNALPNCSFMGFTATPIDTAEKSTTFVFGKHLSIYPLSKAKRHGVIVPIYYEPRLSNLHMTNEFIDQQFDKITEGIIRDPNVNQAVKQRFSKMERIMLSGDYMDKIAKDIVNHYNSRIANFRGKALVVTISRKVAVELYQTIMQQPNPPNTVIVMSGNKQNDPEPYRAHIRGKKELRELADEFKKPDSGPQVAIVIDMWLTGFDVPCLNTMYFDAPMKDHTLAQAIARVNRVFKDKPAGLVVDYIGIADELMKSLATYTVEDVKETVDKLDEALRLLREKHQALTFLLQGIEFTSWRTLKPEQLSILTMDTYDKVGSNEETKKRFVRDFVALKRLYVLSSPHPEAVKVKYDVMFLEMIKKMIVKYSVLQVKEICRELEYEISDLIASSISAEEPVDLYALLGKKKTEVAIFDEAFLSELKGLTQKNYALDMLAKIINDQLVVRMTVNPIRYKSLYESLTQLIQKHNVKIMNAAQIMEQLAEIARQLKKQVEAGQSLGLTEQEQAFYDLLMSREKLFENYSDVKNVAKEIVNQLGIYTRTADWNKKEFMRAKIRAALKNILIKGIDGRASYPEIEQFSENIMSHAEKIYVPEG
jgi:type I restriction enzyme R subunit